MTLMHGRMPVPWVARWSNETDPQSTLNWNIINDEWSMFPELFFKDGPTVRDENGVLWQRDSTNPTGVPTFGEVHTSRQVRCFTERRCQVCGEQFTSQTVPFLLGSIEKDIVRPGGFASTSTPPTCLRCVEVAKEFCPDIAKGYRVAWYDFTLRSSYGPVWCIVDGAIRELGTLEMEIGDKRVRAQLAKQMVVNLHA